jgi:hypothetical protein
MGCGGSKADDDGGGSLRIVSGAATPMQMVFKVRAPA